MSTQTRLINLYPCSDFACLQISGPDANTFLQSQLTQDVQLLSQQRAALAGYCSAQGRLLATMLLTTGAQPQQVIALVKSDLIEGLLKRLRMFVLRSKVVLEVRNDLKVYGLTVTESGNHADGLPMSLPAGVWDSGREGSLQVIRAPSATPLVDRYWVIAPQDDAVTIATAVLHDDAQAWHVQEILAGTAWIQDSTRDLFIPQTINLDLIDGVSFTKGCYPGQEVVARTHYRAKVKRRMHAARVTPHHESIKPAVDLFAADNPQEPCGRVIQVARDAQSTYLLFEAPLSQVQHSELRVLDGQGPILEMLALPYAID